MIRIGIDGNEANVEKRVGISEYAFELLTQFANSKSETQHVKFSVYLKREPRMEMPPPSEDFRYKIVGPSKFWTQFGLPANLYLSRPSPDVFFSPTHYAPRFAPMPTVISVMDLSYIYFPQLFRKTDLYQLKNWTAYSVRSAAKVLTISEASKNDIIDHYGIDKERVVVTYPGIKKLPSMQPDIPFSVVEKKYGISTTYILFVGTLQPRKNIVRLIEAFSQVLKKSKQKSLQLVIVGKPGWLYEEIYAAPGRFNVESNVKFLQFIGDDELQVLYQHALCFALPSLYEGFGLPVLEAMRNKCPVITSNVSSLPEAGGDAAVYVDPKDVEDIAAKIRKVITDVTLRKEMIAKGLQHIRKFSWEKTAKRTLAILEEVASKQ